jgi:valyl-tRNA synthetase
MGSSLDWSRLAYTLDEDRNKAVHAAFSRMFKVGLIYQGMRIVNWDPKMQTTVSDDELEHKEIKEPLYYLKYGPFTIATARPETKFGDKYVVMHPDDPRYAQYEHKQQIPDIEWIGGLVLV